MARSAFWAVVVAFVAWGLLESPAAPISFLGAVPMLWYLRRQLLGPNGLTLATAFGLRPHAGSAAVGVATLMLIALEQLVQFLPAGGHWVQYTLEPLLHAPLLDCAAMALDAVVFAPVFEEIACRGVLYTSLRARLSVWPAALLSGALFAAPHMYSPTTMLAMTAGAALAAYAYERSRSLWPAILAHAFNNALAVAGSLAWR
jgi:membrane protease YdiL (CAAX protease family)